MLVKCNHCGLQENVAWLDLAPEHERFFYQCSNLCEPSLTGYGQRLRVVMESPVSFNLPRVTSLRASALAYKIYDCAAGARYQAIKLSKSTAKALNKDSGSDQIVAQFPIFGRTWRGLKDNSLTAMVIVFENPGELPPHTIYVVFRGSAGDKSKGGSGWMGGSVGTGQSRSSQKVNIDWRANFDNVQEEADWGGGGFMIHGGYKNVLGSYRNEVFRVLSRARRIFPGANVVITGHSQGAGHCILFTHWLIHHTPDILPFVFCMPISPPRVGDIRFANDFTTKIVSRTPLLPYDGEVPVGAMFVVRGHDPVSFSMKHAFAFKSLSDPMGGQESLRKYADTTDLLRKGKAAKRKDKKYGGEGLQTYFHPRCLKILPGLFFAKGDLQVVNHAPGFIRDQIRTEFKKTM